jgi:hypothetical protein
MIEKPWGRFTGRARSALAAVAAVGAVAALAGAVAACGGSSASSTTTATAAASAAPPAGGYGAATTATTAAAVAATGTVAPKPSAGVVSPGTKLSIGQTAKVAYSPVGAARGRGPSTLLVTVKSFKKASLSDFNGLHLDASQKAGTPYYVKVHVTNLGPHNIDVDGSAAAIEGVDTTGNNQQSVTFIGTFPPCPDMASTAPLAPGHGYDDCLTFLIPGGITKVSYNGTNDYIDAPVTWAPN